MTTAELIRAAASVFNRSGLTEKKRGDETNTDIKRFVAVELRKTMTLEATAKQIGITHASVVNLLKTHRNRLIYADYAANYDRFTKLTQPDYTGQICEIC